MTFLFLGVCLALYLSILLFGWGHYTAILLCFGYALLQKPKSWITAGLGFTVLADLCLVVCDPPQRLWGMVFFLIAQIFYAIRLHRGKLLLYLRIGLILAAEVVTFLVLGENTDALAPAFPSALMCCRPCKQNSSMRNHNHRPVVCTGPLRAFYQPSL